MKKHAEKTKFQDEYKAMSREKPFILQYGMVDGSFIRNRMR